MRVQGLFLPGHHQGSASREGGAHQSIYTPLVGMGLPWCAVLCEPAYAAELECIMCWGLQQLTDRQHGQSIYYVSHPSDYSGSTPFHARVASPGPGWRLLAARLPYTVGLCPAPAGAYLRLRGDARRGCWMATWPARTASMPMSLT